jgi:hypothetical protein
MPTVFLMPILIGAFQNHNHILIVVSNVAMLSKWFLNCLGCYNAILENFADFKAAILIWALVNVLNVSCKLNPYLSAVRGSS